METGSSPDRQSVYTGSLETGIPVNSFEWRIPESHASAFAEFEPAEALVSLARTLFDVGLAGVSDNISLKLGNGCVLMSPAGVPFSRLLPSELSLLDPEGEHLGGPEPSSEAALHMACYAVRPFTGAVVHLHSSYATAFSCRMDIRETDAVRPFTPNGLTRYGRVGLVPYHRPGSPVLTQEVRQIFRRHQTALLANHGMLVTGKDIFTAVDNAVELEEACKLHFIMEACPAHVLTFEQQQEILTLGTE